MFNQTELLSRLKALGARSVDIAKVLDIPDSRVAEIKAGKRKLQLAEAVRLVDHYKLERPASNPVSLPAARLAAIHFANILGAEINDNQAADLAADLRTFVAFVQDPRVQESMDAVESFLRALEMSRPDEEETPPEQNRSRGT